MIEPGAEQRVVPPLWRQLLYRAGVSLPVMYKGWVEHDIASAGWALRDWLGTLVSGVVGVTIVYAIFQLSDPSRGEFPSGLIGIMLAIFTVPYLFPRYRARRARQSLNRHKWKWSAERSASPPDGR